MKILSDLGQLKGVETKLTPEEMTERYERIISSCLFALAHVIGNKFNLAFSLISLYFHIYLSTFLCRNTS
jgi:hypothetical protein